MAIKAIDIAQQTNGGATLSTGSRLAQLPELRPAMMFKSFGIQMYYHQFKTLKEMLESTEPDPQLRKQAMRQFAYTQASVMLTSGVQGLTAYGMISYLYDALFKDEDEEDFNTMFRKEFGEGLYKGGVNQLTKVLGGEGVDVAARIGLSNLLFSANRYNFDASLEESLVTNLGGPSFSVIKNFYRGFNEMTGAENPRDFERGLEAFLPAGLSNPMRALIRYPHDGVLTRRGDPIVGELTPGLLAAQVLGFAPAEYTRTQEANQIKKRINDDVGKQRSSMLKRYYVAQRMGDYGEVNDIMEDIMAYNEKWPEFAIDSKAIDASMKRHQQTTVEMVNGVLLNPKLKAQLQEITGDLN
jgi:hypothetical protein